MWPTPEQGLGIFFACTGLGVLLWLAGRTDWRHLSFFGFSFNRPRDKTAQEIENERADELARRDRDRRQLEVAFERYNEVAVAMVSMVEATGPADRSLGAWFDIAAAGLAAALTTVPEDHNRVAVWADFGDPNEFRLLGSANHIHVDPASRSLSKADTIGGHAFRSKSGEYLCADRTKDRRYKTRSRNPKPYMSIFAIRVGAAARPLGVMTIDAPRASSFSPQDVVIIRRFARLMSAAAQIATARYSPRPLVEPTLTRPEQPRIVGPAHDGSAGKEPMP